MDTVRLRLPPAGMLEPNNEVDPLRYYYRPIVGRVFRARIDAGLRLIDCRFRRLLEIGYGSGLLMPTLSSITEELVGVDLENEPPKLRATLTRLGVHPKSLVKADVQELPFSDGEFDGVVAFSILEHLKQSELERAMAEVARVLEPGGRFLVGCPAVHKAMNAAFRVIGFSGIEDHHFSSLGDVVAAARPKFEVERRSALPNIATRLLPVGWAPYNTVLLRKRIC